MMMLAHLLRLSSDLLAPEHATPTIASALTIATVVIDRVFLHRKARRVRTEKTDDREALCRIEGKLDTSVSEQHAFIQEQRQINHEFDTRIRGAYAHLIGEDGEDGQRLDLREQKKRIDALEERERQRMRHPVYDRRSET